MMSDLDKSFWEHAHDLRNTIIKSLSVIFLGIFISLFFYAQIFQILEYPLLENQNKSLQKQSISYEQYKNQGNSDELFSLPKNSKLFSKSEGVTEINEKKFLIAPKNFLTIETLAVTKKLFILGPIDGISSTFKVCLFIGAAFTSPIWLYFILSFIAPALDQKFYSLIGPFLILTIVFMVMGGSFAFFLTIPMANQYLELFNQDIGVNLWSISNYLDYTIVLVAGNAICFEMSAITLLLVHTRVLTETQLKRFRRYFIVGAFILSAILTPPDVLTQAMLAIPLIILYECIILYAKLIAKPKITLAQATT